MSPVIATRSRLAAVHFVDHVLEIRPRDPARHVQIGQVGDAQAVVRARQTRNRQFLFLNADVEHLVAGQAAQPGGNAGRGQRLGTCSAATSMRDVWLRDSMAPRCKDADDRVPTLIGPRRRIQCAAHKRHRSRQRLPRDA